MEKVLCDYALSSDDESEDKCGSNEAEQAASNLLSQTVDIIGVDERPDVYRDESEVLRDALLQGIRGSNERQKDHDDMPSTSWSNTTEYRSLDKEVDLQADKRVANVEEENMHSSKTRSNKEEEKDRALAEQTSPHHYHHDSRRNRSTRNGDKTSSASRERHLSSHSDREPADRQEWRGHHHHYHGELGRHRSREYDHHYRGHHSRHGRRRERELEKIESVRKRTGIALPEYYNPSKIDPERYAEQTKKRKLLWHGSEEKNLDQQYELARRTTHTHRGMGLGFTSASGGGYM
ncbi:unnamed protein product [Soboliphyme baturini]|uniref:SMAP domain-containing protein n=1 Tax=Soboliphyme baturini TaxID=241478 RepID=A0A183IX81_9BILA|nr:unnamed protein product [Soboliphyme baturini]